MPRGACVIRYEGKRGGVWRVKYLDAAGKQVQETLGPERDGWNRRKAEAELRDRLVRVEQKDWKRPGPLTVREHSEKWLVDGEAKRGWKPATVSSYDDVVNRIVKHLGAMPLAAVRPRHIAEYVTEQAKTYSAGTVNRDVDVMHAIFQSAMRQELVDRNPVESAERPKRPPFRPQILEPVEVARVAKAFSDEQARCVFLVLVLCGLRRGELQSLRWRDVDLVENVLRVRDAKSEAGVRSIAIASTLAEALWRHRRNSAFQGDDERVFCHPKRGSLYHHQVWADALNAALKSAGVEKKLRPFHDLRHTAITNDAAAGSSPIAVMTKAGHSSMAVTKKYLHLAGTVFRTEADALEQRLLGDTNLYPPDMTSDDLAELQPTSHQASDLT